MQYRSDLPDMAVYAMQDAGWSLGEGQILERARAAAVAQGRGTVTAVVPGLTLFQPASTVSHRALSATLHQPGIARRTAGRGRRVLQASRHLPVLQAGRLGYTDLTAIP